RLQTYLMHGTNEPTGGGRRSSAGCARMFPEDIGFLFKNVNAGIPVRIINEAYKVGQDNNKVYLEAHLALQEQQVNLENDLTLAVEGILKAVHGKKSLVEWDKVDYMCNHQSGIPRCIANLEESPQNGPSDIEE